MMDQIIPWGLACRDLHPLDQMSIIRTLVKQLYGTLYNV
jgi:hypothetical protein